MGSFAGEEASSEWEEKRQKSRMERLRRRVSLWRLSPESMRDDLENIYMLLFGFLGNGFRLALCNLSWLATRESVVLVPDPIGFAPWQVLFDRGEPCVTAVKIRHTVTLAMRWTARSGNGDVACNGSRSLLNVAGVLMMSTFVCFVQRFLIDDLLLVVVFLFKETV